MAWKNLAVLDRVPEVDSAAGAVSLWEVPFKKTKEGANSDRHAKDIKDVFYREVS